jgi:hypothetical protein
MACTGSSQLKLKSTCSFLSRNSRVAPQIRGRQKNGMSDRGKNSGRSSPHGAKTATQSGIGAVIVPKGRPSTLAINGFACSGGVKSTTKEVLANVVR